VTYICLPIAMTPLRLCYRACVLLLFTLFLSIHTSAFRLSSEDDIGITTREVVPTELQNDIDPDLQDDDASSITQKRRLFWSGRMENGLDDGSNKEKKKKKKPIQEHPLRTDLWNLHVTWLGIFPNKNSKERLRQSKTMQVEFHRNGYCRLCTFNDNKVIGIGTWDLKPWGIWFSIPCDDYDYTFTVGLHLNPFGKQPKLMQGTILKSTSKKEYDDEQDHMYVKKPDKKWFRPVVGTFSGVGIGIDTMDLSYADRGYGLSQ
jgi:hypothetical protein